MKMWIHTCLKCKHEEMKFNKYENLKCAKCGSETTTK